MLSNHRASGHGVPRDDVFNTGAGEINYVRSMYAFAQAGHGYFYHQLARGIVDMHLEQISSSNC